MPCGVDSPDASVRATDAPQPIITRAEFVGGRFFYAVEVDTSDGFALVGRAQFEPVASVNLDRIEELAADELGAGDQGVGGAHVLL